MDFVSFESHPSFVLDLNIHIHLCLKSSETNQIYCVDPGVEVNLDLQQQCC